MEGVGVTAPPHTRSRGALAAIILLSVGLTAALGAFVWYYLQLDAANAQLEQQERELEEQRELIEKKETFGAAMEELAGAAAGFDSALYADLIPWSDYHLMASRAWAHRWNSDALDTDIRLAQAAVDELAQKAAAAAAEASSNASGTTFEAVIDGLSGGHVVSAIDDADSLCGQDVLGCVQSDDPYTIHFDAADNGREWMTDVIRTGLAYHEFAHVLQLTNPEATAVAVESFGGDIETMADCYALTYLPGWKLDHRVWVGSYRYWDVSVGYGYTCNEYQRQVIREWYSRLGVEVQPISM